MDKHKLIQDLLLLAEKLDRTPRRAEFEAEYKGGKYQLERLFGDYSTLVLAAGLELGNKNNNKKINNEIFKKDIEKHIQEYKETKIVNPKEYQTIASISDIHFPFHSQRVLDRFVEYVGDTKPQWIIINGDAFDMYSHGKFPRSHNVFTPREEENLARIKNEELWNKIKVSSPNSKYVQMLGNHDVRPMKRVLEVYPEAEDWIKERIQKLFTFEGVNTIFDMRQELYIDNIIVFHGYRTKLGDHRDFTLYNCINGHSHVGGTVFRNIRGGVLWELNSGLAGDPEAKGLTYTPQKITNWTQGFGAVSKYGPQFISV